jgi:hypothetical protein
MKTGVNPPQNDHNGKWQWTSEQRICGGEQMHLWKRCLERHEFFAERKANKEKQPVQKLSGAVQPDSPYIQP